MSVALGHLICEVCDSSDDEVRVIEDEYDMQRHPWCDPTDIEKVLPVVIADLKHVVSQLRGGQSLGYYSAPRFMRLAKLLGLVEPAYGEEQAKEKLLRHFDKREARQPRLEIV